MRKLIAILMLVLAGCKPAAEVKDFHYANYVEVAPYIYRIVDESAGVVCWMYVQSGGIDCLPLSETLLP